MPRKRRIALFAAEIWKKDMYSEIDGTLLASLGGATVIVGTFNIWCQSKNVATVRSLRLSFYSDPKCVTPNVFPLQP